MIATTLEQSRKLLELGINPDTADMYYRTIINSTAYTEDIPTVGNRVTEWDIPAWSLSALLELIPSSTLGKIETDDEKLWYCNTYRNDDFLYDGSYQDNPIDACIEVINWLKENKYI